MLMRTSVFLVLCVTGLYAGDVSFLLGPTVTDSRAADSSLAPCVAPVQGVISQGLESAFKNRLRILTVDRPLEPTESVVLILPTVTLLRDFREIVAGGRIMRHSVSVAGHVQIINPWTGFVLDSVPRMVEAQVDVGKENESKEADILLDACRQAAGNWVNYVTGKVSRIPLSSSGVVSIVPNPKSFQRKSGAILLAGAEKYMENGQFVKAGGDNLKILDVQPTYSILESVSGTVIKSPISVNVPRKDKTGSKKPLVAIDASSLAAALESVDPDVSPQMSPTQLAGIFAGDLAKNEVADLLMESAGERDNLQLKTFFELLDSFSKGRQVDGDSQFKDRAVYAQIQRQREDSPIITIALRLSAYDHAVQNNPDGSLTHKFSVGFSAELVSPGMKQFRTAFQGEIRQRIEKQGIREIDNKMTVAYLTRSILLKLAADVNGYLEKEYTPKELGSKVAYQVVAGEKGSIAWPKQPSSTQLVRVYRPVKLSAEDQQLLKAAGPDADELKGEYSAQDLPGKIVAPKDLLRYEFRQFQPAQVTIAVDDPALKQLPYAFGGMVQAALEKAFGQTVYVQYKGKESLADNPGPVVLISISETAAKSSAEGCVASGIVRLTAAANGVILASGDKAKAYYIGKRLQSGRLSARSNEACLATGMAQFVQSITASMDGVQMHRVLFGK